MNIKHVFVVLLVVMNGGLAAMEISLLMRRRPWPRWLAGLIIAWAAAMISIGLLQAYGHHSWRHYLRDYFYLPLGIGVIWNLLFVLVMFLAAIVVTIIRGRARKVNPHTPRTPQDITRRDFLYLAACGAAPAAAMGMGVHGALSRYDLRIRDLSVPIPHLPPGLEGFTIAHVSDLHSGVFCGPKRLKIIGDAANDLKADLIVISGDVINDNMDEFPDALKIIQKLEAPQGLYLCEGNHDLIPGPDVFRQACAASGLKLLWESSVVIPINGARFILGGLPWFPGGRTRIPRVVDRLYPERREGDLRVVLAHHPNLFDLASAADLMLSGHTHGGQLMVGPVGFGPLFFEYWSGLYRRGASTLVVSNGAGDWFPCRIGAPAEIGRLRLTRAG